MSAICGLWRFDGRKDAAPICADMLSAQSMYGPHQSAQWDDGDIALGRRLYRLLPEDLYDRQPVVGGAGRFVLVADVRLDNRDDLQRELRIGAEEARITPDSKILLSAWERWGEDCLDHLVGDYAFALWDHEARRLVLARDALGQRPLHYHAGKGFFAFASMPKGLHAVGEVPKVPNITRAMSRIALLIHSPETETYFEGIHRVSSGTVLSVTPEGCRSRRYWSPPHENLKLNSPDEYAEALRSHLDKAVQSRLRGGNGHVGAQLSGGWDSSAVAATAARLLAPSGGTVTAFTSVPRENYDRSAPDGYFGDEGDLARATAAWYSNMPHVLVHPSGTSPLEYLDLDYSSMEEPIASPSNGVWIRSINQLARERGISVLLCGAWGNHGLTYNGRERLPQMIVRGQWASWLREASALVRNSKTNWRGVLGLSFGPWIPASVWRRLNAMRGRQRLELSSYSAINPARLAEIHPGKPANAIAYRHLFQKRTDSVLARLEVFRDADSGNYLKGTLAEYGIDLRDPTSDRRLIEFSLSVPVEQFMTGGKERALARQALRDRLPSAVLDEPRQGYQALDWHESLTTKRAELTLELDRLEACPSAMYALDIPRMRRLVENWPAGGWETDDVIDAYRSALMRGIAVGHFLRRAAESGE